MENSEYFIRLTEELTESNDPHVITNAVRQFRDVINMGMVPIEPLHIDHLSDRVQSSAVRNHEISQAYRCFDYLDTIFRKIDRGESLMVSHARHAGITTAMALAAVELAKEDFPRRMLVLVPRMDMTNHIIDLLRAQPYFDKREYAKFTHRLIEFHNGSTIAFHPMSSTNVLYDNFDTIFIDGADYAPPKMVEDLYSKLVRAHAARGTQIIAATTPRHTAGLGYWLWSKADFFDSKLIVTWEDIPLFDTMDKRIEEIKRNFPPSVFMNEYEALWTELDDRMPK